jgi:DNA-binding NarL/FixJ family response regulator
MSDGKTRIYLVDDHTVLREAVRVMLETEPDLEIVGEAGDGDAAVRGIRETKPDLAIVDLKMPGRGGLSILPDVLAVSPATAILVFTMYDSPSYVYEAMNAGAAGYVLKNVSRDELLRAVRAVVRGGGFLQAEVTRPLLKRLATEARSDTGGAPLTARELEVLERLAEGKTNREIAEAIRVSEETVKAHLKKLYDKLGAADRAQAVAIALRQNLID